MSTVEHETSEHAPGKVRCYSGYGPFGNVAVVLGATVGAGALSNAIGGLISPFVGLVAGIVGAVLCAMLVISDINRIIVE